MMNKILYLIVLFLIISCTNNNDNNQVINPPISILKSVGTELSSNPFLFDENGNALGDTINGFDGISYEYNDDALVFMRYGYIDAYSHFNYTYDSSGRLISILNENSGVGYLYDVFVEITYNDNIITRKWSKQPTNEVIREEYFTFTDDLHTQLIQFEFKYLDTHSISNFTYDANNNIVISSIDNYDPNTGDFTSNTTINATYDSNPNAFTALAQNSMLQLHYNYSLGDTNSAWQVNGSTQFFRWTRWCKNNLENIVISYSGSSGTFTINQSYTYNDENYPITMTRDYDFGTYVENYTLEYYD